MKTLLKRMKQKAKQLALATGFAITQISLLTSAAGAPNINVQPTPFNGSSSLIQLLDYAMYAAWIFVFGLIIYAVFEMRNGVLSEGVKKALGGAIGAAFLLTFGWAILTGAI